MAVDEGSGVASHLANEGFELAIVLSPLFDGSDQVHGYVEGAGAAPLFEGQVPAWLRAAAASEGRKAAFEEGAELSDLPQSGRTPLTVPVNHDWAAGAWVS
jgi:hypothetical protein